MVFHCRPATKVAAERAAAKSTVPARARLSIAACYMQQVHTDCKRQAASCFAASRNTGDLTVQSRCAHCSSGHKDCVKRLLMHWQSKWSRFQTSPCVSLLRRMGTCSASAAAALPVFGRGAWRGRGSSSRPPGSRLTRLGRQEVPGARLHRSAAASHAGSGARW